jgi:hypothetical protein
MVHDGDGVISYSSLSIFGPLTRGFVLDWE